MHITQSLQKWGNGTGVRIPKKVMLAAKLHLNQPLEVSLSGSSIILTPVIGTDDTLTLDSLLKDVTPESIAGELDWGKDVGAEKYE